MKLRFVEDKVRLSNIFLEKKMTSGRLENGKTKPFGALFKKTAKNIELNKKT